MTQESFRRWTTTTIITTIATISAIVALIVSIYSWHSQSEEVKTSREQLRQAQQEFLDAGPRYSAHSRVSIWHKKGNKWGWDYEPKAAVMPYDQLQPPSQGYVELWVTNIGRLAGNIDEAGVLTGVDKYSAADSVWCEGSSDRLVLCDFPISLDPQQQKKLYVEIDQQLIKSLTCNSYTQKNGVVAYARSVDKQVVRSQTGVGLAYATYCSRLTPPVAPAEKK